MNVVGGVLFALKTIKFLQSDWMLLSDSIDKTSQ